MSRTGRRTSSSRGTGGDSGGWPRAVRRSSARFRMARLRAKVGHAAQEEERKHGGFRSGGTKSALRQAEVEAQVLGCLNR